MGQRESHAVLSASKEGRDKNILDKSVNTSWQGLNPGPSVCKANALLLSHGAR